MVAVGLALMSIGVDTSVHSYLSLSPHPLLSSDGEAIEKIDWTWTFGVYTFHKEEAGHNYSHISHKKTGHVAVRSSAAMAAEHLQLPVP